jgi:hypothetical protein
MLLLFVLPDSARAEKPSLEYQVKASLIFNFLQFVEWPPDELQKSPSALELCLIGKDAFGTALDAVEGELVQGRHLKVVRHQRPVSQQLDSCQAIFVARGGEAHVTGLLLNQPDAGALTIGESPDFLDRGGMINLLIEGDRVTFDINRAAAVRARINVSSKLLRVARTVRE